MLSVNAFHSSLLRTKNNGSSLLRTFFSQQIPDDIPVDLEHHQNMISFFTNLWIQIEFDTIFRIASGTSPRFVEEISWKITFFEKVSFIYIFVEPSLLRKVSLKPTNTLLNRRPMILLPLKDKRKAVIIPFEKRDIQGLCKYKNISCRM